MALNSLNIALALIASAACARAGYFMNGRTPLSVKVSVTLVFVALVGYALGDLLGLWRSWLDTLLFGGLAALFLADMRRPASWVRWAQRCAWVAIALMLAGLLFVA